MAMKVVSAKARFEENFTVGPVNECWLWHGTAWTTGSGYGAFWMNDHVHSAHRAAWEIYMGRIPRGKYVAHECKNRLCVNPQHLFLCDKETSLAYASIKAKEKRDGNRKTRGTRA